MRTRSSTLLSIILILGITACSTTAQRSQNIPPSNKPNVDYGRAADFILPDAAGGTFELSRQAAQHRTVVLTFVAADCQEECPKVEAVLRSAAQRLARRKVLGNRVEIATIELDPRTNSLAMVAQLRRRLWPQSGWAFLRGSTTQTANVLRAYNVAVEPRKPGKDLVHSDFVYVINDRLRQVDLLAPGVNLTVSDLMSAIDAVASHREAPGAS